jgi:hypothetical protein
MRNARFLHFAAGLLGFTSIFGASPVAAGEIWTAARGPVPIRNMRSSHLLFLQFTPELPDPLPKGKKHIRVQFDVANNMLAPARGGGSRVIEDHEVQRLTLAYRVGVNRNTEVGITVPVVWRNGGFLDDVLSWWHGVWGLAQNQDDNPAGRESFPRNASTWQVTDAAGSRVNGGSAFGLGETTLTLKQAIAEPSPRGAASWRLGLKLPTGNSNLLLGSESADVGLSLDGRYAVGRDFTIYLGVGGAWLGPARQVRGGQRSLSQGFASVEYHPNSRDSFIFQIDGATAPLLTGNSFADGAQITSTFGYRRSLSRHAALTASFSENGDFHAYKVQSFSSVGPDFTASIGFEWRP